MKALKNFLIFSGIGVIGYAIYRYYKTQLDILQNFQYKVIGLKVVSIKKDNISLDITTRIINNSNVEAYVKEIFLDAYINDVKAGNINEVKDILVRANGFSNFSFRFSFNPQIILGNIINIVTLSVGTKDVMFKLDGYVKVEGKLIKATIPFSYTNNLKSLIKK
jgi:LEA14-like dessication related protein